MPLLHASLADNISIARTTIDSGITDRPSSDAIYCHRFPGEIAWSLLVSAMKRLNAGVFWPIGLVMLMIDFSVQQIKSSRKKPGKPRVDIVVFFFGRLLLVLTMKVKRLNIGVLWPIGLVMLMIDPSVQQQRAGKESGKGRVNMYVVCDPKNLCEFSPCHNGGSCDPISNSDRTPGFRCRCASGFGGEICSDSKYRSLQCRMAAEFVKPRKRLKLAVAPGNNASLHNRG